MVAMALALDASGRLAVTYCMPMVARPGPGHRARRGICIKMRCWPLHYCICCYCSDSILESASDTAAALGPRRAGRAALNFSTNANACGPLSRRVGCGPGRRRQPLPRSALHRFARPTPPRFTAAPEHLRCRRQRQRPFTAPSAWQAARVRAA